MSLFQGGWHKLPLWEKTQQGKQKDKQSKVMVSWSQNRRRTTKTKKGWQVEKRTISIHYQIFYVHLFFFFFSFIIFLLFFLPSTVYLSSPFLFLFCWSCLPYSVFFVCFPSSCLSCSPSSPIFPSLPCFLVDVRFSSLGGGGIFLPFKRAAKLGQDFNPTTYMCRYVCTYICI